jgi:hypothetical protein
MDFVFFCIPDSFKDYVIFFSSIILCPRQITSRLNLANSSKRSLSSLSAFFGGR